MTTAIDRLMNKICKDEAGCWIWTGATRTDGYGQIWLARVHRAIPAHRVAYELLVGPIPEGMDIDHLCRNHRCVNPAHLQPVSRRVNLLRGETIPAANAARTHCPQGHPYDEANTYHRPDKPYTRDCRICRAATEARRRAKIGKRCSVCGVLISPTSKVCLKHRPHRSHS